MTVLDTFRLDGKVAVVTGASKNIGLEIARAFGEAGASVVMAARDQQRLDLAAKQVAETGARAEALACDIATADGAASLVTFVHDLFGQADVLVNNAYSAGDTHGVEVFDVEDAAWEETFAANMLGPFRLCRGLGRAMTAGRGGSIINMLSGSGFLPNTGLMPYGATKAGLWMMTRYLAMELAPRIRVNGLCPGLTITDMAHPQAEAILQQFLPLIPMGRCAQPAEIAPAAVYLASDAASYTTGTVLFVNGGRPW